MKLHRISTLHALQDARKLIFHGFSRGCPAQTENGTPVSIKHYTAKKFCPFGALSKVYGGWPAKEAVDALNAAHGTGLALTDWADEASKKAVLDVFDLAIRNVRAAA